MRFFENVLSGSDSNRRFFRLVRDYGPSRREVTIILVLSALCLATSLYVPLALRGIVDGHFSGGKGFIQSDLIVRMLSALVAGAVLEGLRSYLVSKIEVNAALAYRNRLIGNILGKDIWYFGRNDSGVLVSRVFNDVDVACHIYGPLFGIVSSVGLVSISLLILALLDLALSGVIVLTLVMSIALILPVAKLSGAGKGRALRQMASVGSVVYRVFSNIHLAKANVMEGHEARRIGEQFAELRDQCLDLTRISSISAPAVSLAFTGGILILALYGSERVASGTLAAFFAYLLGLIPALVQISSATAALSMSHAAAKNLFELEDQGNRDTPEASPAQPRPIPDGMAELTIKNLAVRFPDSGELALEVSALAIAPAAFVAVVGQNGSGKSTLLGSILRFTNPEQGSVEFGGIAIQQFAIDDWRRTIAYASPSTSLLPGTVRQNLSYGCVELPDDRTIFEALDLVGARDFVMSRSTGLETEVDEHGGGFSSGQAQRLALARIVLQGRRLILLDEAAGHLDEAGATEVLAALRRKMPEATIIMTTHRLSEAKIADQCFELEKRRNSMGWPKGDDMTTGHRDEAYLDDTSREPVALVSSR